MRGKKKALVSTSRIWEFLKDITQEVNRRIRALPDCSYSHWVKFMFIREEASLCWLQKGRNLKINFRHLWHVWKRGVEFTLIPLILSGRTGSLQRANDPKGLVTLGTVRAITERSGKPGWRVQSRDCGLVHLLKLVPRGQKSQQWITPKVRAGRMLTAGLCWGPSACNTNSVPHPSYVWVC